MVLVEVMFFKVCWYWGLFCFFNVEKENVMFLVVKGVLLWNWVFGCKKKVILELLVFVWIFDVISLYMELGLLLVCVMRLLKMRFVLFVDERISFFVGFFFRM